MPWDSLAAAQKDGMPAELDGAPLTLAQVNQIAELYDAIKADGKVDEPMAVAIAQWKKAHELRDGKWVAKTVQHADDAEVYATEPKVLFTPGRHKGEGWTAADCKQMAQNFEETKDRRKPPLSLGHDVKQAVAKALGLPFTKSGQPKFGEVAKMWWDEGRKALMAVFSGIPKKLAGMIDAGQYDKVSLELVREYEDGAAGKVRRNFVTSVALLGMELPGMFEQDDTLTIAHTADVFGEDVATEWVTFSADDDGGDEVEMKELEAKLAEMETRLGELQAAKDQADELASKMFGLIGEDVGSVEQAEEAIAKMRSEAADAKEKLDLAEKAKREAHEKASKARVDEALAEAVKNEQVLPKNVEAETDVAMSLVGESVRVTFSESDEPDPLDGWLKALKARPKVVRFAEEAAQEGDPPDPEPKRTPEEKRVLDAMGVTPEMEKEAREAGYLRDNE